MQILTCCWRLFEGVPEEAGPQTGPGLLPPQTSPAPHQVPVAAQGSRSGNVIDRSIFYTNTTFQTTCDFHLFEVNMNQETNSVTVYLHRLGEHERFSSFSTTTLLTTSCSNRQLPMKRVFGCLLVAWSELTHLQILLCESNLTTDSGWLVITCYSSVTVAQCFEMNLLQFKYCSILNITSVLIT